MADPARRLAALPQARAAVDTWVAPRDRDTGTALERDRVWLPAGQADIPDHTLGVADTAHRADRVGRVDKAQEVLRHLARLRYTAGTDHTVSGQREVAPIQTMERLVVSMVVAERPLPLEAWLATPQAPALLEPDCPAVQNGGSVVPRIPDTLDHPGAWRSRNAGRLFHPRR
jgi:hypothetical protein